jgi:hypothetical protein
MSTGYVIPLDPAELANRFPTRCQEEWYDDPDDEVEDEEDISIEDMQSYFSDHETFEDRIEPYLERIPKREADLIYMYYILRKKQAEIANIFGVTQAAVSYRLDRGIKRIKFLQSIPKITEEDLRRDLPLVFGLEKNVGDYLSERSSLTAEPDTGEGQTPVFSSC